MMMRLSAIPGNGNLKNHGISGKIRFDPDHLVPPLQSHLVNRCRRLLTLYTAWLLFTLVPPTLAAGDTWTDNSWLAPPGHLVDIGGLRLHIDCQGEAGPVVIMDSGIGGFSLEWTAVQRVLAGKVKSCAYDRAGYGWSDPSPHPRTTDRIIEELDRLLEKEGLEPPYILVGHSFGGYNVQDFAKHYPVLTAGLVLIDSSHPEQLSRLPEIPAHREQARSLDIVTLFLGYSTFKYYPEDVRFQAMEMMSQKKMFETFRRETMNFDTSGKQVLRAGRIPEVPLVVITRGKRAWPESPYGDALEASWLEMQKELAELTLSGRQIIAANSRHMIHLEQPDLVASAIMTVVREVRQGVAEKSPLR